jgi:mgtE-like transporter
MQNLRGSISGSLASRLSTALHQGTMRPSFRNNPELPMYALASILLSLTMSLIIGLSAYVFCTLGSIPSLDPVGMVGISVTVGVLAGIVHLLVNLLVSITSFRMGLDPDNIAIPVLTILGDIVTILFFLMIVRVVV